MLTIKKKKVDTYYLFYEKLNSYKILHVVTQCPLFFSLFPREKKRVHLEFQYLMETTTLAVENYVDAHRKK